MAWARFNLHIYICRFSHFHRDSCHLWWQLQRPSPELWYDSTLQVFMCTLSLMALLSWLYQCWHISQDIWWITHSQFCLEFRKWPMISCVEPTFCTLSLLSVTSEGNTTDKFSPAASRIPGEGLELSFGMKTCKYSAQRWLTSPWFKPVPPKVGSEAKSLCRPIGVCFWPVVSVLALQGKTFRHPWFKHFGL